MLYEILKSKLNPFGNYDDPVAPDWYIPGAKFRTLRWYIRNMFHNFCFYWIGGFPRDCESVFNRNSKWNVIMPFISYRGSKWEWYFGWRERNNFGIAFRKVKI